MHVGRSLAPMKDGDAGNRGQRGAFRRGGNLLESESPRNRGLPEIKRVRGLSHMLTTYCI